MKKSEMSKVTKDYEFKRNLYFAISMVLNFGPMIGLIIYAMISGRVETTQKFAVGASVTVAALLLLINCLFKLQLRSPLFILILGLFIAFFKMKNLILGLMTYICIVQVLDEFLLTPGYKKYNNKLLINKEIDKRG